MNKKRAISPKSPIRPRKTNPTPAARSRSVPNTPITRQTNKMNRTSPRSPQSSALDEILNRFSAVIEAKPVFQTRRRTVLLSYLKNVKQIGVRFLTSHTKPAHVAADFWKQWRGFQDQMRQDIEQQMGRTPGLIDKYLAQIDSALYSFRDKKKMSESVEIVKDLLEQTGEMLGSVMEVRTVVALFNQWKQMQTEFAAEHVTGANSFGVTSGISQLVTQMMVLRDLLNLKASVDTMFEEADRSLKMMIPETEAEVKAVPVREKKKTVYEISGRAPKQADPPVRRTPRVIGESPNRKASPGVQRKGGSLGAQQNGASPRVSQKAGESAATRERYGIKAPVRVSQKGNGEKDD